MAPRFERPLSLRCRPTPCCHSPAGCASEPDTWRISLNGPSALARSTSTSSSAPDWTRLPFRDRDVPCIGPLPMRPLFGAKVSSGAPATGNHLARQADHGQPLYLLHDGVVAAEKD